MNACFKSLAMLLVWLQWVIAGTALAADNKAEFVLGPGDVIRITVFQNPDLTLETRVSENGAITFPLIGQVPVGGLNVSEAEKKIGKALRDGGFVLQPQVNILPLTIRGNQVSVLGQVNRPGRYPLDVLNAKVTDILAMAGGIAQGGGGGITQGGADTLILTGTRNGKPFRQEIDLPSIFIGNRPDLDLPIAGGDTIYVHRAPIFYIYGEVQRPGAYRVERDMTLMQALAQGGGLSIRGTQRGIQVHRRDGKGAVQQIAPDMAALIKADDVIFVKESIF